MSDSKKKAETLLALHHEARMLVLPNVWDPLGARILEKHGYPAVATASAAVSASLGFQDGERVAWSSMVTAIRRISDAVDVPVTADIESGFADGLPELEERIRDVLEAGAVGINLEDGREEGGALRSVDEQCERIARVRETAERAGVPLVINARTDSFLSDVYPEKGAALEEAVARATRYAAAGADCVYPIGPGDGKTVAALRERIGTPINILADPASASLSALEKLGVNRVSFGPFVLRSLMRMLIGFAKALRERGEMGMLEDRLSQAEAAEYLRDGPET